MRTLFGKIFLWFFCAQVLIGAVMFGVGFSRRDESMPPFVRDMLTDELSAQTERVKQAAKTRKFSDFPRERRGGRTVIFWRPPGGELKAVTGLPSNRTEVGELAARAEKSGAIEWAQSERSWAGALASPVSGGTVVVIRQTRRRERPFLGFIGDWQSPAGRIRLALALGAMGLVCFGLARHLTSPVARLRDATQKLTEGDLSARVGFGERGGDELISLGRDFDRMAARLQASTESERRLLGDISHELRSPLARLSVALDLVEQGRARAEAKGESLPESAYLGAFERIRRESGRLNELIGQLLELTRLESQAEDAPLSGGAGEVELSEIVAEVVADAKYEAHSRSCDAELVENQPCKLRGIAPLLHSAIENVVRNAVRYTAPQTCVQVALRCTEKEMAIITVRDFGPGVPEESLEALFRPFYRVAQGRDRESGGVGLGLAIAQRALRVHGGTIEAHNAEGGGLQVEVRLPLKPKLSDAPQSREM